jgi:CRISPR/Cas system Type II protein with McrA/HNH and RuvC-like nuclease domain
LISVGYDEEAQLLFTEEQNLRRVNITSGRSALNGYQKGKCFYCFGTLNISEFVAIDTDVDHFIPHTLKQHRFRNLNGVWNLVLSCSNCNRGPEGKFAKVAEVRFLERLHARNEFLITSHHPLRETLIGQTGTTEQERRSFLQRVYNEAESYLIHKWKPRIEHEPAF